MSKVKEKLARSLVVMKAAGGSIDEILELAKLHRIRTVHIQQLAIPSEETGAQQLLVKVMRNGIY